MSMQSKSKWTYEYTDENNNRFYRLYDRQNKSLCVLNLRHYEDDLDDMDHVNWEMWKSPSHCEDEDHAETLLEYYDSGIYGHGFVSCLVDAVNQPRTLTMPPHWEESPYKLSRDPEYV